MLRGNLKKYLIASIGLGIALGVATPSQAALLGLNSTIPAVAEPDPAGGAIQVGAPLVSPWAGAGFSGTLTSTVFTNDANNPNGLAALTFVYQLSTNAGPGLTDAVGRVTFNGYSGFLTDASFLAGAGVDPALVTRDALGDVVGFSFLAPPFPGQVNPGQFSDAMVVQTNATLTVPVIASIINGTTATAIALGPAVPEPATLGAVAMSGLLFLRRRSR